MKHLEIKHSIAGAKGKGGGSKPKPSALKPPRVGDYSVAASYSYSETVDLISDGPIEGLTNTNGYTLNSASFLQGIYLNDTPVEVTNDNFVQRYDEAILEFPYTLDSETDRFNENVKRTYQKIDDNESALNDFTYKSIKIKKERTSNYYSSRSRSRSRYSRTSRSTVTYSTSTINKKNLQKKSSNSVLIASMIEATPIKSSNDFFYNQKTFACLDISSPELGGFTGIAVDYNNMNVYSIDEARARYAETELSAYYKPYTPSFSSRYYNGGRGRSGRSSEYYQPDIDESYTEWDNYVKKYGREGARNHYGVYKRANQIKEKNIAIGATFFFENQQKNELGENTFYSEMTLQFSVWTESIKETNETGIYRHKIIEGINQLIDEVNIDGSREDGLSREYLRRTLEDIGFPTFLDQENGNYAAITKEDLLGFSQTDLSAQADISQSEASLQKLMGPYMFLSYSPDATIEGFNQAEDEFTFKDIDFIEKINYEQNSQIYVDDQKFYYGGKYYLVTSKTSISTSTANAATSISNWLTAGTIQEIPAPRNVNYFYSIEPKSTVTRGEFLGKRLNLLVPNLDSDCKWDGKVKGFYLELLNVSNVSAVKAGALRQSKKGK